MDTENSAGVIVWSGRWDDKVTMGARGTQDQCSTPLVGYKEDF